MVKARAMKPVWVRVTVRASARIDMILNLALDIYHFKMKEAENKEFFQ